MSQKDASKTFRQLENPPHQPSGEHLRSVVFRGCLAVLVSVPLIFSTSLYSIMVLPKFIALLLGAAILFLALTLFMALSHHPLNHFAALKSKHLLFALLYLAAIAVSTYFGVSPRTAFFGSYEKQMGLLTYVCFFICFIGIIVALNRCQARLEMMAWAMFLTGALIAIYAIVQFVGNDPFLSATTYTFASPQGDIVRVPGTLGHANYLGNFLLYTTPLGVSLAFLSNGSLRRIAMIATGLSIAAIICSGTRGAWLGLLGASLTLIWIGKKNRQARLPVVGKRQLVSLAIASITILLGVLAIALSPKGQSVTARLRSFAMDGLTGSGRTILWHDAFKAVPHYAITGCGPEGFRKAFLVYKSTALALNAPQINNESSHNAYLDAVISYGLAGAIFYLAFIVSAFQLLYRAYRGAPNRQVKFLSAGMLAALVGVSTHNFFIYEQIPTGLYFFVFMALALATAQLAGVQDDKDDAPDAGLGAGPATIIAQPETANRFSFSPSTPTKRLWIYVSRLLLAAGIIFLALAVWYAIGAARSDQAIKQAFQAVIAKDLSGLMRNGEQATQGVNPVNAYDYLFAQSLSQYISSVSRQAIPDDGTGKQRATLSGEASETVETGIRHAEKSLACTLTPESNYVLLANLAMQAGDKERLLSFAEQAINWDANFYSSHLMMAEAWLANDDRERAAEEAEIAIRLNPSSAEARSALIRARNGQLNIAMQDWLKRAHRAERKGRFTDAKEWLAQALSAGSCPACHQLLAAIYEKEQQYRAAIKEWEVLAHEPQQEVSTSEITAHIEFLKLKLATEK
ncbi:MAG: O-antigen ligase family protein [Acidobacteriota bacterium]